MLEHQESSLGFCWRWLARRLALFIAIALAGQAAWAQAGPGACGALDNAYGPYDYRTAKQKLGIVERFHFTAQVEALIRGQSGRLGGDLDYTLRAFPNHHRALMAVMRYGERSKSPQPKDLPRPVACYFERAVRFQPEDGVSRLLYGKYLAAANRRAEAEHQLEIATKLAAENGLSHYNVGLTYFELKEYDKALVQAHRALELGLPSPELKDRLKAIGHWREPSTQPAAPMLKPDS